MRDNFFYIMLFVLFAFSCNSGGEQSTASGNVFFINEGKGHRLILSNNIIFHRTTIYPDVIAQASNADFIIAKQVPVRSTWADYLGHDLYTRYMSYRKFIENPTMFNEKEDNKEMEMIASDSINYKLFSTRGASLENSSRDIQVSRSIADSLIDNAPYYQKIFANEFNYWIIDNRRDTLIGPLTKEEYLTKREELQIPKELQLK